jgi:L-ascorbate metabolism protein UlaG (beta-lactamase superfamily)
MERVHVEPAEAVQAFLDLEAGHFVPIHWGTFDLADEPVQEPPELVMEHATLQAIADRVHLLDIGASFALP